MPLHQLLDCINGGDAELCIDRNGGNILRDLLALLNSIRHHIISFFSCLLMYIYYLFYSCCVYIFLDVYCERQCPILRHVRTVGYYDRCVLYKM